ncbi:MAG: OmpA family protein [Spirochaetes bacterium]|nr:OmpA family protein [Spirochaetota bacterium]
MAGRRKKKGAVEEKLGGGESGSGRWMLTYLDMVTLLFGVFILLAAVSKEDPHKTDVVFASVRAGFAGGINTFSGRESGGTTVFDNLKPDGLSRDRGLVNERPEDLLKGQLRKVHIAFVEEERGLVISLFNDIYFESGKAELSDEAKELVAKLAPILSDLDRDLRIEGHTDEIPVKRPGPKPYDNFNLAADRALNVLHHLEQEGVPTRRMAAVSYGSERPNDGTATPVGKAFNRVVDIVILKKELRYPYR